MSNVTISIRDPSLARIVQVDHFIRLDLALRFNAVSSWLLELPAGGAAAAAGVVGNGIIVVRDGLTLLSGPIRAIHRAWDERQSTVTLSGPDDTVVLRDRLAVPVPSGPPYTAAGHDVRTGVASTVMRAYVDANAGPGATVPRRVANLTLGIDRAIGPTVTGRARFVNLLELLQSLALAGTDVGFRVVQVGNVLEFQVYRTADRTATALFSPLLGTLRGFEYAIDAPTASYVVVGGGGEDTARLFYEQGNSSAIAAGWGRIEMFRDRRDTTSSTEMAQTATTELAQQGPRTILNLTPIQTDALSFGAGYGLGDRVTVAVASESAVTDPTLSVLSQVQDVVREVRLTLTPDQGELVVPVVGTVESTTSGVVAIFAAERALAARVSGLERR